MSDVIRWVLSFVILALAAYLLYLIVVALAWVIYGDITYGDDPSDSQESR